MEIPRGRPDYIPALPFFNREIQQEQATRFITTYLDRIKSPLALRNHVGILTYESDPEDLDERQGSLAEYLFYPPPKPNEWIWGRTIVAEVVGRDLVQAALSHALHASDIYVDLVPTTIDASSRKGMLPYQKGVDMVLMQLQQNEGATVAVPVCGVDVTLGGSDLVKCKRKKPGLQCPIAMPAIVIPLTGLTYDGKRSRSFNQYLDDHAHRQIQERGTYTPFYGLEEPDVTLWKEAIRREFIHGLDKCRSSLERNSEHLALVDYPYLSDIRTKISMTESLVKGASIGLVT